MTLRRPSELVAEVVDRKAARLPHPKPGRVEGRNPDGTTRLRYLDGSCDVRVGITGARKGEVILATPGVFTSRGTAGVAGAELAAGRSSVWLERIEPAAFCAGAELVTVAVHGRGFTAATRFDFLLADASEINPHVRIVERRFVAPKRVDLDLEIDAEAPAIENAPIAYG